MTTSNAAATTTTTAAEAKAPTKMDLARPLFAEIYKQGYKLSEGCKSQRSEFIKRGMAELGLTKNGAATYFQNLTNESRGEGVYKYAKKRDVNTAETGTAAGAGQALEAAKGNAGENEIGAHRWMTVNAAGEEINSYTSRDKAKKAASETGLEWKDRNAGSNE